MTPEVAYFLKINVAIALFYAFYRLFFYKDTFFHWRRLALLCFFAVALLYPLLNIQDWIKANDPMVAMADLYATVVLPEFAITASQETFIDWQELIIQFLKFTYWGGISILTIRFLVQLGSIIRLHFQCPTEIIQGTCVHILNKEVGPFSFFHWIFINPKSHTEPEISEILTHEKTHVCQHHSLDVSISELMCVLCWFNPFIWLMKREVRSNLEYMADNKVLETGHDSKSYQYHLLGLAHHKAAANLSNSFNVLPLKNRIKMMNKRRTKEIGRTKYLLFLPLATLLMIISNIEMVARTTKEFAKEMIKQTTNKIASQPESTTILELSTVGTGTDVASLQDKKTTKDAKTSNTAQQFKDGDQNNPVLDMVEEMPEFPGGMKAFIAYLEKNTKYPVEAHAAGIQGRAIVNFIVRKDGSISDCKISRSADPYLDKEAIRVISTMPKWKPGKEKGQVVNVKFTAPVTFKLSDPTPLKAEEIKASDLSEIVVVGYGDNGAQDNETPMQTAEQMPRFPGGQSALMQYLARSIKYPIIAQKNKEQGKVIIQMIIGKDGNISNISIIKSLTPSLDAEAVRVMSNMPKWEPGIDKGKAVPVFYTIPVLFRLQ